MKKFFLLGIAFILAITVSACSSNEGKENQGDNKKVDQVYQSDNSNEDTSDDKEEAGVAEEEEEVNVVKPELGEDWRSYEAKVLGATIKYHKNWYFSRNMNMEKIYDYKFYVAFSDSPDVLKDKKTLVEFVAVNKNDFDKVSKLRKYVNVAMEDDNYSYVFLTDTEDLEELTAAMAKEFSLKE